MAGSGENAMVHGVIVVLLNCYIVDYFIIKLLN